MAGATSGSPGWVNLANLAMRCFQLLLGITLTVLGAYELHVFHSAFPGGYLDWPSLLVRFKEMENNDHRADQIQKFGIAVGFITFLSSAVLAVVPYVLSYSYVAYLFAWDFFLFFLAIALFARSKSNFNGWLILDPNLPNAVWPVMNKATWIDLAVALLWLVTAIMGLVLLISGRSRFRGSRVYA